MKRFLAAALALFMLLSVTVLPGCSGESQNPVLVIELDETASSGIGGTIKIELKPEWSPNSVSFMIWLAQNGLYDDCPCFKTVAGNIIAFGDKWNRKKIDRVVAGEFEDNGYLKNSDVSFEYGTVGLWHEDQKNDSSFGSFFVIVSSDGLDELKGYYAPVGEVIEGMDICNIISAVKSSETMSYEPFQTVRIKSVSVLLHGKTYSMPETAERTEYPGVSG